MTLGELHEQCRACTKCRLRKGATQVVPGEGSPSAEILFIGEGPGAVEDRLGRPFVGPAGKFLDTLLESIKLKRSDVFIANMVKCRPPENRDPQEDEMEACAPWLDSQIEVIGPKIIVPLGRHAMHKFLPQSVISQEHGKIYRRKGLVYFLMYHPAVALYNGSMRAVLLKDFTALRRFLDGEMEPESLEDTVSTLIAEKNAVKKAAEENEERNNAGADQVGMSLGV